MADVEDQDVVGDGFQEQGAAFGYDQPSLAGLVIRSGGWVGAGVIRGGFAVMCEGQGTLGAH
ncbi:MAG: hypothetical protein ABIG44_16430 [Planctomycetota bacterium]